MAEQEEIIYETVDRIMALPGSDRIEFIYLFGSAGSGKSHVGSDIDICIYYDGTDQEAYNFLLNVMSKVDSIILDIKLFRQLPLYIRIDVFKGRLLYSKRGHRIYEIAHDTLKEYEEFEPRFFDYIGKEAIR